MAGQDFEAMVGTGLLEEVERIVVEAHRSVYERAGRWTPPGAYRWLRYENSDPVARLCEGVERLRIRGAKFDAEAVDKACASASKAGFLN